MLTMSTPGRIEEHKDVVVLPNMSCEVGLVEPQNLFRNPWYVYSLMSLFSAWLGTGKANDKGDEN